MLKKVAVFLCLTLWPINLFLNNTSANFIRYSVPLALVIISYYIFKKVKGVYHLAPILLIGIFEPKLVLVSIIYSVMYLTFTRTRPTIIFVIISIAILVINFKPFYGQTIFYKDYEAEQLILRNIHIYPDILTARIFQNKSKIYFNKLADNFFTITDPNNYFFGLHPRPIVPNNQNIFKFPFVALIFFIIGLYFISESKHKFFIYSIYLASIVSLITLQNFDRHDFILYLPTLITILYGVDVLENKNKKLLTLLLLLTIIFGIPEVIRGYVEKIY